MDKIKKQIKKITGDLNAIPKEKEQTILTKLVDLSKDLEQIQYYVNDLKYSLKPEKN
jgi:tetrahydromethanopterin S-methyltransferase subunit B|tara:strand:- start:18 stop:188 length:171 start_codon:yes stop_codon:yes gene_type:complete